MKNHYRKVKIPKNPIPNITNMVVPPELRFDNFTGFLAKFIIHCVTNSGAYFVMHRFRLKI